MITLIGILAAASPTLGPVGPWRLDPAQTYCLLSGDFAGGATRATLTVTPFEGGRTFAMGIVSPAVRGKASTGTAKLSVTGSPGPISLRYSSGASSAGGQSVTLFRPPDELMVTLLRGGTFTIEAGAQSWTFAIPASDRAHASLTDCQSKLIKSWTDAPLPSAAEFAASGATPAKLDPRQIPAFADPRIYPDKARIAREEGTTQTMLVLSATGRVEQCIVLKSAGETLDQQTCELFSTLHYSPETDASGKPVATRTMLRFTWQLPH